jgi:hypothetical protein
MRSRILLTAGMSLLLPACATDQAPTGPDELRPAPSAEAAAASNTWSPRAAPPGGGGIFERFAGLAPNSAGESVVYLFGGTDGQGTGFQGSAYNVSTDTWSGGLVSLGLFGTNGVGKIGNRLYFSGGIVDIGSPNTLTNRLWAYDYANDRLIARAPLPIFSAHGVTGVISGRLYVLPGECGGERYPEPGYCLEEPTRRFYRYNPSTNTWTSRRQAPHVHRLGAAAVISGKLYVAGGFNGFDPVTWLDVYDPGTNTWRTLAPVPSGGRAIGAALGGKLHVLVGTSHYAYDPATNRWKALAPTQYPHEALFKVQVGGRSRLLAVGGVHGSDLELANPPELYTP